MIRPVLRVALAAAAVSLLLAGCKPASTAAPAANAKVDTSKPPSFAPVGSRRAKVQIEELIDFGVECQWENARILQAVAAAVPKKVYVTFHDTNADEGKQLARKYGVTCKSQLVIGGQKQFTITRDGKQDTVMVHGPFNLTSADNVVAVLQQAIESAYGPLSADEAAKIRQAVTDGFKRLEKGSDKPADTGGEKKQA